MTATARTFDYDSNPVPRFSESTAHEMTYEQAVTAADAMLAAINICFDGNIAAFGKACDVTSQAALAWVRSGVVPVKRLRVVCQQLGGMVSREELRPDIYGAH